MKLAMSFVMSVLPLFGAADISHAQNNNPARSGTYYEDQAAGTTTSSSILYLSFAQLPSDKNFNLSNVGCLIRSTPAITQIYMKVGTTSGGQDLQRIAPISFTNVVVDLSEHIYSFNSSLYFKIGKSRFPTLLIDSASGTPYIGATCTINGTLSDD
ncbi:MAG: hypothetical protein JOZ16_14965 [Methylobacteriaceae bacterium]|nr:hypothetical protein [Methylobacteriaceae bacterium]